MKEYCEYQKIRENYEGYVEIYQIGINRIYKRLKNIRLLEFIVIFMLKIDLVFSSFEQIYSQKKSANIGFTNLKVN